MTGVRWLSGPEDRAWRGYRQMRTLLDLQLARDLADGSGLSEPDYDVLSTLTERPGSAQWRASELATHLLWSSSRLAHHVTLTGQGRAVLEQAAPGHVESVRRNFIDLLTPAEVDTLAAIAEKVTARLNGGAG